MIQAGSPASRGQLGPCAEKIFEFAADNYEQAKEKMINYLYGGETDANSAAEGGSGEPVDVLGTWSELSQILAAFIKEEDVRFLQSKIPQDCLRDPMQVMTWITIQENHAIDGINEILNAICTSKEYHAPEDKKLAGLIAIRLSTADNFVDDFCTTPRCVIPVPKVDLSSTLRWFLKSWWEHVGVLRFSEKVCTLRLGWSKWG